MCRKFVLISDLDKIEDRFRVRINPHILPFSGPLVVTAESKTYVITCEHSQELQAMKFGFTPYWANKPMNLINARAEGDKNQENDPEYNGSNAIFLKSSFKKPIQSQRCMVIADAYIEWSAYKKPYLVYLQNKERPFAFAGIYDQWKDPLTGLKSNSFAIITTTANSLLQKIGVKRMPVILPRGRETDWIKSPRSLSQVLQMLLPYPFEQMNAYPISDRINTEGIDDLSIVNPIGEKLQEEATFERMERRYRLHKMKSESVTPWFGNNR